MQLVRICTVATLVGVSVYLLAQQLNQPAAVDLPTSKLLRPVPGKIGGLNSFPATIALSPDGLFAAMLHAGYGTQKSRGCQSISIFDLTNSRVADFPDDRLCEDAHQSYFLGLTFSADGKHLYASLGSITDPTGSKPGDTGNTVAVYGFEAGKVSAERLIKIAPQKLAQGKWVARGVFETEKGTAVPYPAGNLPTEGREKRRALAIRKRREHRK